VVTSLGYRAGARGVKGGRRRGDGVRENSVANRWASYGWLAVLSDNSRSRKNHRGNTKIEEVEQSSRGVAMEASHGLCLAETVGKRERVAVVGPSVWWPATDAQRYKWM